MHYSRRDFLKVAVAGLPVVGLPLFFPGVAPAREAEKEYTQAQAAAIHKRSVEDAIRRAGERPEEVKARMDRRIRDLKASLHPPSQIRPL
jgi:hypothetical protein